MRLCARRRVARDPHRMVYPQTFDFMPKSTLNPHPCSRWDIEALRADVEIEEERRREEDM